MVQGHGFVLKKNRFVSVWFPEPAGKETATVVLDPQHGCYFGFASGPATHTPKHGT